MTAAGAASIAGCGSSGSGGPGTLGISGYDIDQRYADAAQEAGREIPPTGAVVNSFLDDPPAQDSGIHGAAGGLEDEAAHADIVETGGGKPATAKLLSGALPGHKAGETVTLHVWPAHGRPHDVKVELAAAPKQDNSGGSYYPGG